MTLKTKKTYSPKPTEISHDWVLIDADGQILGRLAAQIAQLLLGKHKPQFSAHLDLADNVVVINAAKVAVTGNKLEDKHYYHHTGYPGGIKDATLSELMAKRPEEVIERAVRGMLPKNRLSDDRMAHLKVYAGAEHPHSGQKPTPLKGDK